MNLGYYPGCALHGTSDDYEQSLRACFGALGVELDEIGDWICCGATAAHSLNPKLSIALPARNLALAAESGFKEMLAPCSMCSMQLLRAQRVMSHDRALAEEITQIVEAKPNGTTPGSTRVMNLIQAFEHVGLDAIKAAVKKPLADLPVACYYGCLLTRPPEIVEFDDCEQPMLMEAVVAALGAKPVDWNYKTECCGAGMTMASEETVLDLSNKVLTDAAEHGAKAVAVACPMCHVNLDMKQSAIDARNKTKHEMPIYYLSDLVGLALGLTPERLGVNRHFVQRKG
jgi:heterodisulfide reductase subunit B